jgi:hypothetical protein
MDDAMSDRGEAIACSVVMDPAQELIEHFFRLSRRVPVAIEHRLAVSIFDREMRLTRGIRDLASKLMDRLAFGDIEQAELDA